MNVIISLYILLLLWGTCVYVPFFMLLITPERKENKNEWRWF